MKLWERTMARLFAVVIAALVAQAADATPVTFSYSGVLHDIVYFRGASDSFGMTVGQTISGSFVVETSTPDGNADPLVLFQPNALSDISFAGFSATSPAISYSTFSVDAAPSQDAVTAYANVISGDVSDVYQFSLSEPGPASILGSDNASLLGLSMSDFDPAGVKFSFQRAVGPPNTLPQVTVFDVTMTQLSIYVVSEPGTFALLSAALICIVATRRRIYRAPPLL